MKRLGYKVAAKILSEAMPQTPKGRSGDLGEILATELVEEEIGLRVPVRRLRYKDGRNMAMRGDDSARRRARWLDVNGAASKRRTLRGATLAGCG